MTSTPVQQSRWWTWHLKPTCMPTLATLQMKFPDVPPKPFPPKIHKCAKRKQRLTCRKLQINDFFFFYCWCFSAEFHPHSSLKRGWGEVENTLGAPRVWTEEGRRGATLGASFLKPDSPQTPPCYSSTAFPGLWKINVLCTANSS